MPLACDPTKTFDTWLRCDADTPADKRPTFVFRYPTTRQAIHAAEVMDGLGESDDGPAALRRMADAVRVCLAGWRNMGVEYDRDNLEDVLTFRELSELLQLMLRCASPSVEDLGKSDAQP